jgi:hypothetical protein
MRISKMLAATLGFAVAAIGALGVAAPAVLLELGQSLQTTPALYVVAGVRIAFGVTLLWAAPESRTPRILRTLGFFIVIAGVLTPFFGIERMRVLFEWWSAQSPFFTRAWSVVAMGFGFFVVYSVVSARGWAPSA